MTPHESFRPFARHGCEKMLYDLRMGPHMVRLADTLYIVYQANECEVSADPFIIAYDIPTQHWSEPVKVGDAARPEFDHHNCPVLWIDTSEHLHVLFNCHGGEGTHRISVQPRSIESWCDGPAVSPSISYPHAFHLPDGRICIYFRVFGHMGYWAYSISRDGGYSWGPSVKVVDFDQNPANDADTWAGSYHTALLDVDGHTLHVGFTYFDERGIWKFVHPRYGRKPSVNTRYHLYYLRIDLNTGIASDVDGKRIQYPINRKEAEQCKIWDSGDALTMMPAMLVQRETQEVSFLIPVTEETEWKCGFHYVWREQDRWLHTRITETNTTWSGCRLIREPDGVLSAYLIVGKLDGSRYTYGAGELEKWISTDDGRTWVRQQRFVPIEGHLYNNPVVAEDYRHSGVIYSEFIAFYGWEGPYSLQPVIDKETDIPIINRGMAYLIHAKP